MAYEDFAGEELPDLDAVDILTVHQPKGLEWPIVFMPSLVERRFPSQYAGRVQQWLLPEEVFPRSKAVRYEGGEADERRLFYVGMTRAKDVLWLTGATKRRLYAKFQDQEPSRFLRDIPREWCHWIDKISGHQAVKVTYVKKDGHFRDGFSFYNAGCRVKHPAWGIGVVRDCCGDGDDQKVMVNFPNFGVKRLAVRFANLEKI